MATDRWNREIAEQAAVVERVRGETLQQALERQAALVRRACPVVVRDVTGLIA